MLRSSKPRGLRRMAPGMVMDATPRLQSEAFKTHMLSCAMNSRWVLVSNLLFFFGNLCYIALAVIKLECVPFDDVVASSTDDSAVVVSESTPVSTVSDPNGLISVALRRLCMNFVAYDALNIAAALFFIANALSDFMRAWADRKVQEIHDRLLLNSEDARCVNGDGPLPSCPPGNGDALAVDRNQSNRNVEADPEAQPPLQCGDLGAGTRNNNTNGDSHEMNGSSEYINGRHHSDSEANNLNVHKWPLGLNLMAVQWDKHAAFWFLVGSALFFWAALLDADRSQDVWYDDIIEVSAASIMVFDAFIVLVGWIVGRLERRGSPSALALIGCVPMRKVDWSGWGDWLFMIGSLLDMTIAVSFVSPATEQRMSLTSSLFWMVDAMLYVIAYSFGQDVRRSFAGGQYASLTYVGDVTEHDNDDDDNDTESSASTSATGHNSIEMTAA